MAQAIQVKYLPPTNYRGARFSVRTQAKTKIYNEPINAFGVEQNALVIATRFAKEMGWTGVYYTTVERLKTGTMFSCRL